MDDVKVFDATESNSAEELLGQNDADFAASLGLEKPATDVPVPPRTPDAKKIAEAADRRALTDVPMEQAKEDVTTPAGEQAKPAPEPTPEETVPEPEPEEEVEPERPLLTKFETFQGEEEIDVPTDLKFNFKANGKDYKDVPVDKVVLWAQMGVYNEAREEEVRAAKQFVAETTKEAEYLRTIAERLVADNEALLENEELYETARQQWLAKNTPEERARRAEQQLKTERATEQQRREQEAGANFIATQIYPVLEHLLQNHNSVSEDEVLGRFNRLITPYLVNGRVPTQQLSDVKRLVESDLTAWVKGLHMDRDTTEKSREQKSQKAIAAEKTKTALAKRQAAKPMKPKGSAVKETPKQRTYKSAEDWASTALDDILQPS